MASGNVFSMFQTNDATKPLCRFGLQSDDAKLANLGAGSGGGGGGGGGTFVFKVSMKG